MRQERAGSNNKEKTREDRPPVTGKIIPIQLIQLTVLTTHKSRIKALHSFSLSLLGWQVVTLEQATQLIYSSENKARRGHNIKDLVLLFREQTEC